MVFLFARVFFFLIGFGLTTIGAVYIISYLNLLTIGYNFSEYVNFIIRQIECLYTVIGLIIMALTIFIPERRKHELHI